MTVFEYSRFGTDKLFFRLPLFSKPSFTFREVKYTPLTASVRIALFRSNRCEMFYRNRFSTKIGSLKKAVLQNKLDYFRITYKGVYFQ